MVKSFRHVGKIAAVAIATAVLAAVPTRVGSERLAMLDTLQPGQWELRLREPGAGPQRICIPNGRTFIQLRHQSDVCDRFVVGESAAEVTVQYTCRGRGYGRTRIRRETATLVQIDSQGIADSLPFEFTAEARRIGPCGL